LSQVYFCYCPFQI